MTTNKMRIAKVEKKVKNQKQNMAVKLVWVLADDGTYQGADGEVQMLALPDGTYKDLATGRILTEQELKADGVICLHWRD